MYGIKPNHALIKKKNFTHTRQKQYSSNCITAKRSFISFFLYLSNLTEQLLSLIDPLSNLIEKVTRGALYFHHFCHTTGDTFSTLNLARTAGENLHDVSLLLFSSGLD